MSHALVRQVRAGYFGTVSYAERHVSEPVPPEIKELAAGLSTLPKAQCVEALETLTQAPFNYDAETLSHQVYLAHVRRMVRELCES